MWNLNGDDVQRAKEELKGRRAAIQARYESELKQLEVDITELETFERFAVKFVTDFRAEDASAAATGDLSPPVETAAEAAAEQPSPASADSAGEQSAEAESAASAEPAGGQRSSSRWRMRLNTGEAAP